ncbi:hypothetical protein KDJ56_10900 [Brevibacillus composti]|uniref:Uncharacterized protein n=1 Tax=Brevibacillus composti TaxID=2796470 RepID=A0A7T5EPG2_9BACL|nr:hypothetical protein [Brevibacillus composti]QQE76384.1 hypothetical protein JD108_11215 [Brevibacillus composti]QUO43411.1 hypothetical protein KDJ56_10900 [Brevibacillus composti]
MEQLIQLATDYWPIVVGAILLIIILQLIVKSLFRIISIFIVIGVVLVLVFEFSPEQVINMGRSAVQTTQDALEGTVVPLLDKELKDATITFHEDGSYEMKTKSIRITGKKGDTRATVHYGDNSWDVDVSILGQLFEEKLKKAEASAQSL